MRFQIAMYSIIGKQFQVERKRQKEQKVIFLRSGLYWVWKQDSEESQRNVEMCTVQSLWGRRRVTSLRPVWATQWDPRAKQNKSGPPEIRDRIPIGIPIGIPNRNIHSSKTAFIFFFYNLCQYICSFELQLRLSIFVFVWEVLIFIFLWSA